MKMLSDEANTRTFDQARLQFRSKSDSDPAVETACEAFESIEGVSREPRESRIGVEILVAHANQSGQIIHRETQSPYWNTVEAVPKIGFGCHSHQVFQRQELHGCRSLTFSAEFWWCSSPGALREIWGALFSRMITAVTGPSSEPDRPRQEITQAYKQMIVEAQRGEECGVIYAIALESQLGCLVVEVE